MGYFEETYRHVNDLSTEGRRSHWRYLDLTIGRWLPAVSGQPRILDVGCGAGIVLEWLAARGYRNARGVDTDPGQVEFARSLGLQAELSRDVPGWLDASGVADFVILKDVLEHVERAECTRLLRAIERRLGPQGRAYIAVPNASSPFAARWRYIDATHLRSYTELSLSSDLSAAGLRAQHFQDDDVWATRSLLGHCQQALKRVFRSIRRVEAAAEFGAQGWHMPLGLNLVAIVQKAAP